MFFFDLEKRKKYLKIDIYLDHSHTLSKCPGGHTVLHRKVNLNSRNPKGKYEKKIKITGFS